MQINGFHSGNFIHKNHCTLSSSQLCTWAFCPSCLPSIFTRIFHQAFVPRHQPSLSSWLLCQIFHLDFCPGLFLSSLFAHHFTAYFHPTSVTELFTLPLLLAFVLRFREMSVKDKSSNQLVFLSNPREEVNAVLYILWMFCMQEG